MLQENRYSAVTITFDRFILFVLVLSRVGDGSRVV